MNLMLKIARLIRYRFFLFAGLFPYLLGQAAAFNTQKPFNWHIFNWGFLGIFLVLTGVELFNEYFDSQTGGDRIFTPLETRRQRHLTVASGNLSLTGFTIEKPAIPKHFYILGLSAFALAFCIGLYLTYLAGWGVLFFCFMGFLAAYFYVGPPFRWAYRGLGEIIIALSYGPLMVLGSYYIQAKRIDIVPFYASLICGLSIFCLAILNEIPDFYQDRLIGKKNLVVRMGRQGAVNFLSFCFGGVFLLLALGIFLGKIPTLAIIIFLFVPWLLKSIVCAQKNYDNPLMFRSAVNANIAIYLLMVSSISIGYLINYPLASL